MTPAMEHIKIYFSKVFLHPYVILIVLVSGRQGETNFGGQGGLKFQVSWFDQILAKINKFS